MKTYIIQFIINGEVVEWIQDDFQNITQAKADAKASVDINGFDRALIFDTNGHMIGAIE